MSVVIGSARCNEFGGISGGKPGDQTGHECERQEWYNHELGWIVARAKSAEAREKIARNMEAICDNPYIGYDQPRNQTLYKIGKQYGYDASKVETPCDTDCARSGRFCILYAGIDVADFYTVTAIKAMKETGQFDIFEDANHTETDVNLLRGDIIVTRSKGHLAVVLSDGEYAKRDADTYEITGNTVNMRLGPGTEWPVIQVLRKYDRVHGSSVKDGWLQCEANGKYGYVSMKYLKPLTGYTAGPSFALTSGNVFLRMAPGVLNKSLGVIGKGQEVKLTGESRKVFQTTWHQVAYGGKTGWVSGKYLKV